MIEKLELQKKWNNLLNNEIKEVLSFFHSEDFNKIKDNVICANVFVQKYWSQEFDSILFSFDNTVLKNPFFLLSFIESSQFDIDKHLSLVKPLLNDSLFVQRAMAAGQDFYQYSTDDVKNDYHVAVAALKLNGRNFKHLPDEYKGLDEFKMAACENEKNCGFQELSLSDRNNPVYYNIARKCPESYQFFTDSLKIKLKKMVVKTPSLLQYAPNQVKGDDKLIYEMLKDKPFSILYAPEKFRKDKELCYSLFLCDKNVINSFDKEVFEDLDFCKRIINHKLSNAAAMSLFLLLPKEIQTNNEFVKDFIVQNSCILKFVTPEISQDIKFLQLVQSKHCSAFKEIPPEYKKDNLEMMKSLCTVIINKKIKKDPAFSNLKPKEFIDSFPMEKYNNIKEHLLSMSPTIFKPIYEVLNIAILENSLSHKLEVKETKTTLIKI
jgi:hypothetical protein